MKYFENSTKYLIPIEGQKINSTPTQQIVAATPTATTPIPIPLKTLPINLNDIANCKTSTTLTTSKRTCRTKNATATTTTTTTTRATTWPSCVNPSTSAKANTMATTKLLLQQSPIIITTRTTLRQQHRKQQQQHRKLHTTASSFSIFIFMMVLFVCFYNQMTTVEAAEGLSGDLQSCSNEGEEVKLNGIKNSKCFRCACQNGFVNCDIKESCPSINDCYILEQKSSDNCCRKCKGCIFRGISYASGSEWTDPDDPCKIYKCIASVVTETTMKCYTQCDPDQIAEPRPGECCPKCQGCKINGQKIDEGQEFVDSIDDPCLVCRCSGDKLTCAKKSCPVLQCPISKQIQHPNECCPRCTEHRVFMPLTGKCFFYNKVLHDKTQFTPDRCTNCTCTNGTSICQRNTCPILECSPHFQEMDGCCPRCITSEVRNECVYNGVTYQNNATWNLSPCRSCRCTSGNIRCSERRCSSKKCRPNEELKVVPGECCPKCVETAGTCTVFGDPHFKTFDKKFYSFQGSCKYLLTADCHDHTFSIRLTNDGRGTKRSSWAKTVTIKMKGVRINLGQKLRVKVNGSRIVMPYTQGAITNIERLNDTVFLKTDLGVHVEWDGNNFLQITVPTSYKQRLCGLCGNFNGIGRDDLTGRDGSNHSDEEVWRFANSWKVGGPKACSRKIENIAAQPTCKQKKSNEHCWALRDSKVFGNCDNRLNPINYLDSCKMDVCECPTGMCHCDSYAAYAHECQRLGVQLPDWRNITNCPSGLWRRNATMIALYNHNNAFGRGPMSKKNRRRKLQQLRERLSQEDQLLLQQTQLQHEIMSKYIPKGLLMSKSPDRTPPPLQ